MNQPQEGAESILDHSLPSKPTQPVTQLVNLTFWQTCKAHPLPAAVACLMVIALIGGIFWASSPTNPPAKRVAEPAVPIAAVVASEPVQTAETPIQPQITPKNTPKKRADQATKTPARGANLTASDDASTDILGDFITKIEREKAAKTSVPAMPVTSASNLELDFESRLFNFERKIP